MSAQGSITRGDAAICRRGSERIPAAAIEMTLPCLSVFPFNPSNTSSRHGWLMPLATEAIAFPSAQQVSWIYANPPKLWTGHSYCHLGSSMCPWNGREPTRRCVGVCPGSPWRA